MTHKRRKALRFGRKLETSLRSFSDLHLFDSKRRDVAFAATQQDRRIAGQINHGGEIHADRTAVDHQFDLLFQQFANVFGIVEQSYQNVI